MSPRATVARLKLRLGHPRTTVRWRLTMLYGGLFLVSGAALLAITYTLVDHSPVRSAPVRAAVQISATPGLVPGTIGRPLPSGGPRPAFTHTSDKPVPGPIQKLLRTKSGREAVLFLGSDQRVTDLHQLVEESAIALAVMAIVSTLLGWVVAGRVLSPLRTMTEATREISAANLDERLAMPGPPDELRQLADTIDGLLGRLEGAFDAQRRFVANASHELRTPLTSARALLELVLSDPGATVDSFRVTCRQVLEESAQQEQLIDALLALAQGQRGIDHPGPVDLMGAARLAVAAHESEAAARGLTVEASLHAAVVSGDGRLISRLVSNLVENALRHNVPAGTVWVRVHAEDGRGSLIVANTGPVVPAAEIPRLLAPFQRLAVERTSHGDGLGLGLSIVAAIAIAHDASLELHPRPEGGLEVTVSFPAAPGGGPEPLEIESAGVVDAPRLAPDRV